MIAPLPVRVDVHLALRGGGDLLHNAAGRVLGAHADVRA